MDKQPGGIAILGECMVELSGPAFGIQQQAFGGDTLNTAIYLSRLLPDLFPRYVTVLGHDHYSDGMLERWKEERIDCSMILRDQNRLPGMYAIEIDKQGERCFHYWRNESAARFLCQHEKFTSCLDKLHGIDLLYLSGISIAILPEEDKDTFILALQSLKAAGVTIAFDSNYRPRLWDNHAHAAMWINRLYQLCDIALVTADDESLLLDEPQSSEMIIERLHHLGVSQVIIKLGKEGSMWSLLNVGCGLSRGEQVQNVIDTTAAGDSFNAGFLAARHHNLSVAECCRWGNKVAAEVIQHRGAIIGRHYIETLTRELKS